MLVRISNDYEFIPIYRDYSQIRKFSLFVPYTEEECVLLFLFIQNAIAIISGRQMKKP